MCIYYSHIGVEETFGERCNARYAGCPSTEIGKECDYHCCRDICNENYDEYNPKPYCQAKFCFCEYDC
ncbi:hypothetical protein AAHA92_15947 [Salvia divinorum]|uniref:Defensin-like protein n=1 Tax=Salvia divinorum TaxID=28513 RepID=A0ABD1GTY3_SALDI